MHPLQAQRRHSWRSSATCPLETERLDLLVVQVALLDHLLDEVLLFEGAVPGAVVGPLGLTGAGVRVAAALSTSIAVRGRQIPRLLDGCVNARLEQFCRGERSQLELAAGLRFRSWA